MAFRNPKLEIANRPQAPRTAPAAGTVTTPIQPGGIGPLTPPASIPPLPGTVGAIPTSPPSTDPFGDYLRDNPRARDSWAYVQAILDDYGLGSLSGFVRDNIIEGRSEIEVMQRLRETTEYKTRFRAIEERKKAGLAPISESEVVAYERQARQLMRSAGLPEGFYDDVNDFVDFLTADISVSELGTRVNDGYVAVSQAPPEVREYLEREEGLTPGDMVAYFLDEQKALPVLERKVAAARLGGTASRSGYGNLNRTEAESIAAMGVTDTQAAEGFGSLVRDRELFTPLGQNEDMISREEQQSATFRGNRFAQERIERRRRERQATFSGGGGGYTTERGGIAGLGSSRR